jgi:thiamine biosynthesis lipoprotein
MSRCDVTFSAMGSEVRLIVGDPGRGLAEPARAAAEARAFVERFDAALSRFRPESELSALNADPRSVVPASGLLRDAVRAGIWAAERTNGLVDPTLLDAIEAAGYRESRAGLAPASLRDALLLAPPRRPAKPDPAARWREITVDEASGVVRRPPGVGFDTGGTGKGLCADLLAERLAGYGTFVVDCGGDVRVGGTGASADSPCEIHVEHPLSGEHEHVLRLVSGAVATSGINVRVWQNREGRFAHHLLDPATGEPAWTGVVGVTAIGETASEAETLSKAALLSGPEGARRVLAVNGGLVVHDSGWVESIGPLDVRPRIAVTVPRSILGRSPAAIG